MARISRFVGARRGAADCLWDVGMQRYYCIFVKSLNNGKKGHEAPSSTHTAVKILQARDAGRPLAGENADAVTDAEIFIFFLRDRDAALLSLRSVLPLSEAIMDRLFSRIGDTIYATIYGTLAVSSAQGVLGGLMFWWLGLSAPLLWGVVMALLAVVPVLGAFIVWIPAALFLVLEGNWGKALILALWGMFVVGTVDNLLRPILVGNRLKLHTALAFMSVVGGLILFGPAGLILGPLALTVTTVLLEIWRGRIATKTLVPIEPE